jgi:hypothetical protein
MALYFQTALVPAAGKGAVELGRLQAETTVLLGSFIPALLAKAFRGEL